MKRTCIGTPYFVSFVEALIYYRDYGADADRIEEKIKDGEIFIGKPPIKDGEMIYTVDGRYHVETI